MVRTRVALFLCVDSELRLRDEAARPRLTIRYPLSAIRYPLLSQAALRRREVETQLQVPHVQRMALQSAQTVKSTDPK
jgi:hypothetical protein